MPLRVWGFTHAAVCIYIYREREREWGGGMYTDGWVYREMEKEREREREMGLL